MTAPDLPSSGGEFQLTFNRRRPPQRAEDLLAALHGAVDLLESEDRTLFRLYGYSPSMERVAVKEGGVSRAADFLATSDIEWNFGREPHEPTREVVFFNDLQGASLVYLRFAFFLDGERCSAPGLEFLLRLGVDAAGGPGAPRAGRLFIRLAETLAPDSGSLASPSGKVLREIPSKA